jgi:hypothetical protein
MHVRAFTLWVLIALLAFGSTGISLARHAPAAVGYLSLCTSAGETVIAVDGRGEPVSPGHPCPDCTLAVAALVFAPAGGPHWAPLELPAVMALRVFPARAETTLRAHPPRGPPALV